MRKLERGERGGRICSLSAAPGAAFLVKEDTRSQHLRHSWNQRPVKSLKLVPTAAIRVRQTRGLGCKRKSKCKVVSCSSVDVRSFVCPGPGGVGANVDVKSGARNEIRPYQLVRVRAHATR